MKTSRTVTTGFSPARFGSLATPTRHATEVAARFHIDTRHARSQYEALAADVRDGLLAPLKALPPKYFYDDRGAQLFEAICDVPEYYLTRTEHDLLATIADDVAGLVRPAELVEFGSGASRKTRLLLTALQQRTQDLRYVAMDVNEGMLRQSGLALLQEYPRLRVHAVVGDYERDLRRLPPGRHRLVAFLGSTIGNLTPVATRAFLEGLRQQLTPGEHFLLGVDLVKPIDTLEAAYNDRAGVTAEFNRNILRVINQHLDADFDPERFEHLAFFNRALAQIEMHLRVRTTHRVAIRALDLRLQLRAGETIHTEISRKFTRAEVEAMLETAGFRPTRWYEPANGYFGLVLARVV